MKMDRFMIKLIRKFNRIYKQGKLTCEATKAENSLHDQ